jgi:hypothetical protein
VKADQLILAASCSAADAMADSLRAALQEQRLILQHAAAAGRRRRWRKRP